jgi:hypothetical protein
MNKKLKQEWITDLQTKLYVNGPFPLFQWYCMGLKKWKTYKQNKTKSDSKQHTRVNFQSFDSNPFCNSSPSKYIQKQLEFWKVFKNAQ